jgi:hypothetical protein
VYLAETGKRGRALSGPAKTPPPPPAPRRRRTAGGSCLREAYGRVQETSPRCQAQTLPFTDQGHRDGKGGPLNHQGSLRVRCSACGPEGHPPHTGVLAILPQADEGVRLHAGPSVCTRLTCLARHVEIRVAGTGALQQGLMKAKEPPLKSVLLTILRSLQVDWGEV